MREAAEIAKPFGVTLMLEFARSSRFAGSLPTALKLVRETKAFGVPTIRLDGGKGHHTFGPVLSELPSDEDAVKLLDHITWLMRYENFGEFKRERLDLDVPSAAAWRARQAAKAEAERAKS